LETEISWFNLSSDTCNIS